MGAEFTMMWYLVPLVILILLTTILSVLDKHFRRTVLTTFAVCLGNCAVTAIIGLLFGINIAAAVFVNLIFFSLCMSSVLRMICYARLIKLALGNMGWLDLVDMENISTAIFRTVWMERNMNSVSIFRGACITMIP